MQFAQEEQDFNASINTTPLVDVMLVLLIIFLITIPVVIHTVPVQLPKEINQPNKNSPRNIILAIDKEGVIFWGPEKIPSNQVLLARLKEAALLEPQPEVHIRGDERARYEFIGKVITMCQKAGLAKIGFIIEPPGGGN